MSSHSSEVHKSIPDHYSISNIYLVGQFLNTLILFHLLIKAIIHMLFAGSDVEKIKYFESIYYPHIAGVASRPYIFNRICICYTLCLILIEFFRFNTGVEVSLKNRNKYIGLRVCQLISFYLASF